MQLTLGQDLDGNIVRSGPMGEQSYAAIVYKVESTLHKTNLILKLFKRIGEADEEDEKKRFFQECKILHDLSPHDRIIAPYGNVATNGQYIYYLMEEANFSLLKYHEDNKKLDLTEIKRFFTEVCEGLEHAHSNNTVHRDLYWNNILLKTTNGVNNIKLTDFGRAKDFDLQDLSSEPGSVWGAVTVTPPEIHFRIIDSRNIDDYKPGDIYALGILLHFLFQSKPIAFGIKCLGSCESYLQQNQIDKTNSTAIVRKAAYQDWLTTLKPDFYNDIIVKNLNDLVTMEKVNTIIIKLCNADYTKRYTRISDLISDINNL